MEQTEKMNNDPIYLDFLVSQMFIINDLSYFNNIKKYSNDAFVLGLYNFVSVLKEHNKHLAICMTKVPYDECAETIAKSLKDNVCTQNCINHKILDNFLKQFRTNDNTDQYYKKFSISMPVDKMCNDICQIILDKSWVHTIASLATFEFIVTNIYKKLNEYALSTKKNDIVLLPEENTCSLELLRLLDNEDRYEIKAGITDMFNIFCALFNEIDELYYSD